MKKRAPSSTKPARGQAALQWAVDTGHGDALLRHMDAAIQRARRRRQRAISASVAALALLAAGVFWRLPDNAREESRSVSTVVLRPAQQRLSDGTVVELREHAAIVEQFEPAMRRVILQSGEAHFAVAKNPARPFVVVAGGIEVRAIGTSFAVGLGQATIDVVVTEGRVAVGDAGASYPAVSAIAHLDAGNRLVVEHASKSPGARPQAVPLTTSQLHDRLSWRVPRLEFSSTPLSEAIAMFNRHGPVEFVLEPALGALEMSGVLRADNTDALLRLLKDEFGIEAEREETRIVLRRR